MLSLKCLKNLVEAGGIKSAPFPKKKTEWFVSNLKQIKSREHSSKHSLPGTNNILRMASYFEPYIMHFIEKLYSMHSMAFIFHVFHDKDLSLHI